MKKGASIILLAVAITLVGTSLALSGVGRDDLAAFLVRKIPPRPARSPNGSEFARAIFGLSKEQRELAIRRELTAGNLPDFLRDLKPVRFSHRSAAGLKTELTLFVMPDYLAVGTNEDFLLLPISLPTALEVALTYGFVLPTRKIVDAVFGQSSFHLKPQPLAAGPRMRSAAYYEVHNEKIAKQRLDLFCPLGELISGHKKDLVMTNRLIRRKGKVAIYGWHKPSGDPIQPLTTVHGATYADYSHGVRLIGDTGLLDGRPWSVYAILADGALAPLLSDEGPLTTVRDLMLRDRRPRF